MEEKTMPSELLAQALDGVVRDLELAGNLTESGAGDEPVEDGLEKLCMAEPVAGLEGL
jgi:hypothetical protein